MSTNSDAFSPTPAPPRSSVTLVILGYVPPSQNALKGCHWSIEKRERDRALWALRDALESFSGYGVNDLRTGTTIASSTCKTALFTLEFWMETHGISYRQRSSAKRFTINQRRKRK